jgi:hypothetical protein
MKTLPNFARHDFLAEIHHLLWLAPFENKGQWDEGWNCRDHALITACLVALCGQTPSILNGKVALVDGRSETTSPLGIEATAHSCVGVIDAGIVDLSLRFAKMGRPPHAVSWPVEAIIHSQPVPPGVCNVTVTRSETDYERKVAEATHLPGTRSLVYQVYEGFQLTMRELEQAFEVTNSPLTDRLRDELCLQPNAYAKAVLHLWNLLNGAALSLTSLSQDAAWREIAGRKGNAIWRIASRTRLH